MGQYLQDFMSASNLSAGEHLGNYLEEQTGRAPTQMNDFPLPARSAEPWTEWFQAEAFGQSEVGGSLGVNSDAMYFEVVSVAVHSGICCEDVNAA
jgi:hypothetical protein